MELQGKPLMWLFPLMVIIAFAEALYISRMLKGRYQWQESATSLAIAIGQRLNGFVFAGVAAGVLFVFWEHRLWTVPLNTAWGIALLFAGLEFFYYWHHRVSHESRWFWATHAVHHSPQHFNLSAAYRLGWTGVISGHFLFYAPLALLGFHPAAIALALALNLTYQFWLHTELVGSLGWFDKWFNSPSNHRVHHATNPDYLDCNYGGVTMVFDRLFGTYVPERRTNPPAYGLVKQVNSHNPLVIAFHEWIAIGKDLVTARSLREVAGYLFARPGWRPDGSGMTTANLKRVALKAVPGTAKTSTTAT
jgi:sterol desaturase/sphingolipid hydroxylase (fatty acid hydroxylase superfamily)